LEDERPNIPALPVEDGRVDERPNIPALPVEESLDDGRLGERATFFAENIIIIYDTFF
jgi:hypothetical protein